MLAYDHRVRRRARAAKRIALMAAQGTILRDGLVVPTYWWDGHPNFGDDLTPWLLPRLGIAPIHRPPKEARLIGIGSILEFLPQDWDGAIWGSGLMHDHAFELPRARRLAVRGRLTAERIGANDTCALGDPGILIARFLPRPAPRWDVALVPHGHHRGHREFMSLASGSHRSTRVVNVHQSATRAAQEIASASLVVTTSLHGLITADSYGIPAVWTTLEPAIGGGDFKFRDYESVITPGSSRFMPFRAGIRLDEIVEAATAAPSETVASCANSLLRSLEQLRVTIGGRRFPSGVIPVMRNTSAPR